MSQTVWDPAHTGRRRGDVPLRAALVLAAAGSAVLDAPPAVRVVLVLVALVALGQVLVAAVGRGTLHGVLVTIGGSLVALVLMGLMMDLTGIPLGRVGWAATTGVVGAGVLVLASRRLSSPISGTGAEDGGAGTPLRRAGQRAQLRWEDVVIGGAALALVVVALTLSVDSTSDDETAPLALSVTDLRTTSAMIHISSGQTIGPLEVRTSGDADAIYGVPSLAAGSEKTLEIQLPATGRVVITLNNPGQEEPLRALVVDR